jgi:hypothetical protein
MNPEQEILRKDLRTALEAREEDLVWQIVITIQDNMNQSPEFAWSIVSEFGSKDDELVKEPIATCLLEHLLEHHFERYFPQVEKSIRAGNFEMAKTFLLCWKYGQSKIEVNEKKWDLLAKFCGRFVNQK